MNNKVALVSIMWVNNETGLMVKKDGSTADFINNALNAVKEALGGERNIESGEHAPDGGVHIRLKDKALMDEKKLRKAGIEMMFKIDNGLIYLSPFIP